MISAHNLRILETAMDMPLGAIPELEVASRSDEVLKRVSAAVGVPVTEFLNSNAKDGVSGAAELLSLLLAIKSEQGRNAALDCLRAIAQDQAD
ncbi:hypothetical protein [Methylobacterium trifolii]|uniref:Uncharacterized protein n=1 Tax=Methylobacterium trifolii TaxID=1003092 RepID=A0ABQ4U1J9_9HYPH|nr:hypothetical protein [Methylobacterium trifolii]GJE60747.1 hypothetical protein MPOCJGCO_2863 [Methylobacterium trifolii]